jgi:glycerophosphoryl diester phosphodiesterase
MKLFIRILSTCLLIIAVVSIYLFIYEPSYRGDIKIQASSPLLFAHRGFGNNAPDNSLVGAERAVAEGLNGVDVDAQLTKDKQTVIFHDVTLERFTEAEGRVDGRSLDELKKLDLGSKYGDGSEYKGAFVASFDEFVSTVVPKAYLMVELKVASLSDTGIERDVIDTLSKHDAFDRVLVSSFNPAVLYRLKKIDSRVQTVFIFQDSGWDPKRISETKEEDRVSLPWYLRTEWTRKAIRKVVNPDALSINQYVDEEVVNTLIEKGWPVFLWSLNDESSIVWGVSKKPFGIVTDEPMLAKQIVEEN